MDNKVLARFLGDLGQALVRLSEGLGDSEKPTEREAARSVERAAATIFSYHPEKAATELEVRAPRGPGGTKPYELPKEPRPVTDDEAYALTRKAWRQWKGGKSWVNVRNGLEMLLGKPHPELKPTPRSQALSHARRLCHYTAMPPEQLLGVLNRHQLGLQSTSFGGPAAGRLGAVAALKEAKPHQDETQALVDRLRAAIKGWPSKTSVNQVKLGLEEITGLGPEFSSDTAKTTYVQRAIRAVKQLEVEPKKLLEAIYSKGGL